MCLKFRKTIMIRIFIGIGILSLNTIYLSKVFTFVIARIYQAHTVIFPQPH